MLGGGGTDSEREGGLLVQALAGSQAEDLRRDALAENRKIQKIVSVNCCHWYRSAKCGASGAGSAKN